MSTLFESLRNTESRFLNLGFLALAIIGNQIDSWVYFVCLLLAAAIVSTLKLVHDKKWLASADKYIRIIDTEPILKKALIILSFIALALLLVSYEKEAKWLDFLSDKTPHVLVILPAITGFGNYFDKFVCSIKTFDEGIQLPGRKGVIVPWKEVYTFTDVDNTVTISSSQGEQKFSIDPEDYRYTRAIIADWKSKSGRRY